MFLQKIGVAAAGLLMAGSAVVVAQQQQQQPQQPQQAQKKPEFATYVTAESAPKQYRLQGEYVGEHGDVTNGIQVIALGKDGMRAVFYGGGLPGAGWNGKDKGEVKGVFEGENVVFTRPERAKFRFVVGEGKATITIQQGGGWERKTVERRREWWGARPPGGGVVLCGNGGEGSKADAWNGGNVDERGLLMVGCTSKQSFKDFTMHLEFVT